MAIIRETRIIDHKGRVLIPKATFKELNFDCGDEVYFEATKTGNLLIKKVKKVGVCDEN